MRDMRDHKIVLSTHICLDSCFGANVHAGNVAFQRAARNGQTAVEMLCTCFGTDVHADDDDFALRFSASNLLKTLKLLKENHNAKSLS